MIFVLTRIAAVLTLALAVAPEPPRYFVPESHIGESAEARTQIAAERAVNPDVPCHQPSELDLPTDRVSSGSGTISVEAVVIGRVRGVTPGWNTSLRHVTTLVVLDDIKIVRDRGDQLAASTLTFEDENGVMVVNGKKVCTEGLQTPVKVGDVVAVGGRRALPGHLEISSGFRYLVRESIVEVRPPFDRSGWRDVPRDEFEAQIRKEVP